MVTKRTSGTASSRRAAGVAFAIVLATTGAARAEPDCPTASEEGQRQRDQGHVLQARELFRACAKATCPGVVRKDCTKWLTEIEESLPSIVVAARDGSGNDLTNVKVSVDGKEVATKTDGKAIAIDPGEHVLRFEADGLPTATEKIVVRVGEKNRLVKVQLGEAPATTAPVAPAPAPAQPPIGPPRSGASESSTPRTVGFVLGGVGILAIGGFAILGGTAKSDLDGLKSTCAPYCAQADLDSVKTRMLVGDILLGTGVAALVVGTVLVLTHLGGGSSETRAARR